MGRSCGPATAAEIRRTLGASLLALLTLASALMAVVVAQGSPPEGADVRLGQAVYVANCAGCHQLSGEGVRAAVPPLAGSVPELLAEGPGREYLLHAVVHGMNGKLTVSGRVFNGVMPSWRHLSDAQLAAVLNYVAYDWGNVEQLPRSFSAFTPFEIASTRTDFVAPRAVSDMRP